MNLRNIRKTIWSYYKGEHAFLGRGTPSLKKVFSFFLRLSKYGIKNLIITKSNLNVKNKKDLIFLKENGYLILKKIEQKQKIITKVKPLLRNFKTKAQNNKYPLNIMDLSEDQKNNDFILSLARLEEIKNLVLNYFNYPVLFQRAELWYSPNKHLVEKSSQKYHFDNQDDKSLLFIMPISEIDTESGPFTFLNAKLSLEFVKYFYGKYAIMEEKRIDEKKINSLDRFKKNEIQLLSSLGDAFLVDGDRCLHYGSRKAKKERFMLVFHFVSETNFNSYRSSYIEFV